MAYFSNGTMGDLFRSQNCYRCVNWKDEGDGRGPGCPIMDAHLVFDYYVRGAKDDDGKPVRSGAADVLDLLIPRAEFSEDNAWIIPTCSMLHLDTSDAALERQGQLNAFGAAPEWTEAPPTEQGWYWYRGHAGREPSVVFVEGPVNGQFWIDEGSAAVDEIGPCVICEKVEWMGPIPGPIDARPQETDLTP